MYRAGIWTITDPDGASHEIDVVECLWSRGMAYVPSCDTTDAPPSEVLAPTSTLTLTIQHDAD